VTAGRKIVFYRCPSGTVAFDSVFAGGTVYQLERHGMCPLCKTPVAEHDAFTLRATREEPPAEDAA
jgi:hypothetical protein